MFQTNRWGEDISDRWSGRSCFTQNSKGGGYFRQTVGDKLFQTNQTHSRIEDVSHRELRRRKTSDTNSRGENVLSKHHRKGCFRQSVGEKVFQTNSSGEVALEKDWILIQNYRGFRGINTRIREYVQTFLFVTLKSRGFPYCLGMVGKLIFTYSSIFCIFYIFSSCDWKETDILKYVKLLM